MLAFPCALRKKQRATEAQEKAAADAAGKSHYTVDSSDDEGSLEARERDLLVQTGLD